MSAPAASPHRLARGGLIDRLQQLDFHFDGNSYRGYAGDTLASALLGAGVKLFGRSFKYHRPRGVFTAGSEEPNALVELRSGARREPNTRATTIELFEGLEAYSQNRWPSLRFDVGAVSSLLAPIFVAGFYYKTFMWPAALWERLYEPLIRRAAGLGRASAAPDPDVYERAHAFCDVLVIGGGPSGLSAALAAGRSGARVILCEEDFALGGRLNSDRHEIDGMSGVAWSQWAQSELAAMTEVRLLPRTTVFGAYDGNAFGALERVGDHRPELAARQPRQRLWKIIAERVILAAGAIERPIVFGGNDRPGVMLASAARTYLNRFGVLAGRRAALFTSSDSGWQTALELADAGVAIEGIIDVRTEAHPALLDRAKRMGLRVEFDARVTQTRGARGLRSLIACNRHGRSIGLRADLLAVSGGWSPNLSLSTHLGGRPRWSSEVSAFVPGDGLRGMLVVGAARGSYLLADALREGTAAGSDAAQSLGFHCAAGPVPACDDEPSAVTAFWYVAESRGKSFVDFQNDVTREDVELSCREGFQSVEHLKRYTTLGMGTDQGKTSNLNGLAILASLTGRDIQQIGTTAFRPPYTPVAIGALGGPHRGREFRPIRLTPSHHWAQEQGATFIEAGPWLRAQWFAASPDEDWLATVMREVRAVRSSVGVCDVSTLGKVDIQGADAGVFLDRVYINSFSSLPVGKVRYGLMLREDGFVMDDGTSARLATDHYLMSTTTVNAGKVLQHLEHARQVLWPELDVQLTPVTEQWAQYAIAGPQSRQLLERLFGDALDVSNAAFPFMACAQFEWCGARARLFRISFSGEHAYELAVPARYGDATIRRLMAAGAPWSVTPYGMEALGVMRIEKGHIVGNEFNGTTTAADLGLGRLMSTKKDFIGRTLAARAGLIDPNRLALVGVRPRNPDTPVHAGAHLLAPGTEPSLQNDEGYVTSVAFSPTVESWIGLALLKRGPLRHGEHVRAYDPLHGSDVELEIVSPAFFDPQGIRLQS